MQGQGNDLFVICLQMASAEQPHHAPLHPPKRSLRVRTRSCPVFGGRVCLPYLEPISRKCRRHLGLRSRLL